MILETEKLNQEGVCMIEEVREQRRGLALRKDKPYRGLLSHNTMKT